VAPTWQSVLVGGMLDTTNSAGSGTFDGWGSGMWSNFLVHGNNHYILSGPLPNEAEALAMARNWSVVHIGEAKIAEVLNAGRFATKSSGKIWIGG